MKNVITFVLILWFPLVLSATIRNVPTLDYPTIQACIDSAVVGDTVLVAEGHYYEQIFFKGKEITVASQFIIDRDTSHISKTIIDGSLLTNPDSGTVVYFIDGENLKSVLYGFTITGGSGSYSNIKSGSYTGYMGGGVLFWTAGGRVEYNRIINNVINLSDSVEYYGWGAGIAVEDIESNSNYTLDSVIIRNNTISHNSITAAFAGMAAIDVVSAEYMLFEKNIVEKNITNSTGDYGGFGAVGVFSSRDITLSSNIIRLNKCNNIGIGGLGYGGGIYVQRCSPKIYNNIIMENYTNGYGGGISLYEYAYQDLKALVINNTIINNIANDGGGIWIHPPGFPGALPVFFNNIIWGNIAITNPGLKIKRRSIHLYNSLIQDIQYSNINNGVFCCDPMFANNACYLCKLSPCLGHGTACLNINGTNYESPVIDYDGNPRPSVADPGIDLGALESNCPAIVFPSSFNQSHTFIDANSGIMHFTSDIFNHYNEKIEVFCKIYNHDRTGQDSVEMLNGDQHGDDAADDGLYGASYQTSLEDIFTSAVIVQNNTKDYRYEYSDNQKFTTIGPLKYMGYNIVTSGDSVINPGEKHRLEIEIQNQGQIATATNIKAWLTPLDSSATMTNNNYEFGNIHPGQTILCSKYRIFKFSDNYTGSTDTAFIALDITSNSYTFWQDTMKVAVEVINNIDGFPIVPKYYSLEQNYPNPFNPKCVIHYALPVIRHLKLSIYNNLGQKVATLVDDVKPAGYHSVEWNASEVSSGVYYYRLDAEGFSDVKKMVVMK